MVILESHIEGPKRVCGRDRSVVHIAAWTVTVLFGLTVVINLGAAASLTSPLSMTHFTAAAFAGYLLVEARLFLRRSDALGLLSPGFLALVLHFFPAYLVGITVAAFDPRHLTEFAQWLHDLDSTLSNTLLLAMLAAFCMLRGNALGQPLARKIRRSAQASPLFRRRMCPNFEVALGLQVVYLVSVAYAIQLGVYGMLSDQESQARHISIIQFLNLSLAAGTISFFLIMLRHFKRRSLGRISASGLLVVLLIAIHVLTGALSAFKSQIVLPFVVAGFAYFLAKRQVPLRFIALAGIALVMAYSIVEPFRAYMNLRGERPSSVSEAVEAIGTAYTMREQLIDVGGGSRGAAIASRADLSGMTALAVDYVDRGQLQSGVRQQFQFSIFLAPILAYVPRVIWEDKPSYSPGVWFNQNVRGRWGDEGTSVAMGPIGYLYMAGGVFAVVFGFLGLGVMQALIFEGVGRSSAGGWIIFLSVVATLVTIPTAFGPALTSVLRMLPIAFAAQLVLLHRSKGRGHL